MDQLLARVVNQQNFDKAVQTAKKNLRKSLKRSRRSAAGCAFLESFNQWHLIRNSVYFGHYEPEGNHGYLKTRPNKSPRPISVPAILDYVVQLATLQVLDPISANYRVSKVDLLHPSIIGNKIADAANRVALRFGSNSFYSSTHDLKSYYTSIDRAKLRGTLLEICKSELFVDHLLLMSQNTAINFSSIPEYCDHWTAEVGLPQGGGLSPLLANLYAINIDLTLASTQALCLRYADDILIASESESSVSTARASLHRIVGELMLSSNHGKDRETQNKLTYLGFEYSQTRGTHLSHSKVVNLRSLSYEGCVSRKRQANTVSNVAAYGQQLYVSWASAYKFCNLTAAETNLAKRQILFGLTDYCVKYLKHHRTDSHRLLSLYLS